MPPLREGVARKLWIFFAAHVAVWTLLPLLTHLDYSFDVLEGITWGRHLQWGYPKHPPLAFWMLGIIPRLPGWPVWIAYLFSQLAIVACLAIVWKFARQIVDEQRAWLAVLALECVAYYNGLSTNFNPNVLQLPLWAAVVYFFWQATRSQRWSNWICLGVFAGLGLLTKYYTGMLLLPLGLLLLLTREGRAQLRRPGPWIALALALAVFSPHILWLAHNAWLPFHYAVERATVGVSWPMRHLGYAAWFAAVQILVLLPVLLCLLALPGRGQTRAPNSKQEFEGQLLWTAAFGPFLATIVVSMIFGWRLIDVWGTPLWTFLPLWFLQRRDGEFSPNALRRFRWAWSFVVLVLLVLFGLEHRFDGRKHLPGPQIAEGVTRTWHERQGGPLRYVIGDTSAATTVSVFSPDHPDAFVYADPRKSPGVVYEEVQSAGAMMVWQKVDDRTGIPYDMGGWFQNAEVLPPVEFPSKDRRAFAIAWAYVPPAQH